MKRHSAVFLAFAIACALPFAASGEVRKYDIEKAVISYEKSNTLEKFTKTYKVVLSFDGYGERECRDIFDGERLKESLVSDGANQWLVIHSKKTARQQKGGSAEIGETFDWDGRARRIADMTVAGMRCAAYEIADGEGTTTIAVWNRIVLYKRELPDCGCTDDVLKAVKVEGGASIAPEKFQPPDGYTQERD